MSGYTVSWTIDINDDEATNPQEAAQAALAHFRRAHSVAHVFTVTGPTGEALVDLDINTGGGAARACSCGEADHGAPFHDGDLDQCPHVTTETRLHDTEFQQVCCDCGRILAVGGSLADFIPITRS